jgi:hypothetical protein
LVDKRVAERGKLPGTFIIVKERLVIKEQYGSDIISCRETLYKE